MKPADYGNYYFCIKTDLSESGEIYAHADKVIVNNNGDLLLNQNREDGELITLSVSAGNWSSFFAASGLDGSCVSVEHWEGEYVPDQ